MRAHYVALLSVAGMLLTSASVWSLTTPGGGPDKPTLQIAGPETAEVPDPVVDPNNPSRFQDGKTLTVEGRLGHAKLLRNGRGETFVMLDVRGGEEKAQQPAPVNLGIVIDRSGSMKGTRIRNAIDAATRAVDRLREGDTVSVVTFDTRSQLIVPPTTIDAGSRSRIQADIRGITLGGDTCISCGVEDGMTAMNQITGKVNRMILLSDGDTNSGVRDAAGFRSLGARARDRGVVVTTIGVDVDFNEKIMSALAEESNGRHYFVENDASLERVFQDEADNLTSTVASNVEATVTLAPGVELDRVFDRSFRRNGNRVVVPLGAFGKGDVKTVLMKVRVSGAVDGLAQVADVELTYNDLVARTNGRCAGRLATVLTSDPAQASDLDGLVAGRIQRSETASVLDEANSLFAQGRVAEARRKLDAQAANLDGLRAKAKKAAPSSRGDDVDRDFDKQLAVVNSANSDFAAPAAAPPPAPFGGSAGNGASATASPFATPPAQTREGKAATKRNVQREVELAF